MDPPCAILPSNIGRDMECGRSVLQKGRHILFLLKHSFEEGLVLKQSDGLRVIQLKKT